MKNLLLASLLFLAAFSFGPSFSEANLLNTSYAQEEVAQETVEQPAPETKEEAGNEKPSLPVPDASGDPVATLGNLVTDWKTMSPLALGIAIILLLTQFTNSPIAVSIFNLFGVADISEHKRLVVTILGVAYGVLYLFQHGNHWTAVLVTVISSGGAVSCYEAIKGLVNKFKKKKTA